MLNELIACYIFFRLSNGEFQKLIGDGYSIINFLIHIQIMKIEY